MMVVIVLFGSFLSNFGMMMGGCGWESLGCSGEFCIVVLTDVIRSFGVHLAGFGGSVGRVMDYVFVLSL